MKPRTRTMRDLSARTLGPLSCDPSIWMILTTWLRRTTSAKQWRAKSACFYGTAMRHRGAQAAKEPRSYRGRSQGVCDRWLNWADEAVLDLSLAVPHACLGALTRGVM